jgi:hypothetical protein
VSEYLEGQLSAADRASLTEHQESCARCRRLLDQVGATMEALHSMEMIIPPPRLVERILAETLGPRHAPEGLPWFRPSRWLGWMRPVLEPRLGMSLAAAALSAAIVFSALGVSPRDLRVADLNPAQLYRSVDRHLHLAYARGAKFVGDLRVVYEIQSRLQITQPEQAVPAQPQPEAKPKAHERQSTVGGSQQLVALNQPAAASPAAPRSAAQ